jgi:hypothetical protein
MSSKYQDQAALLGHPVAALNPTGYTGVYRIALTGSSQSVTLPTNWPGRFVELTVVSPAGTTDVQYGFSSAASQTIVRNQASAVGTGHASAGKTIFPNTSKDGRIRVGMRSLNFISSAAEVNSFLEICISEVPA